MKSVAIIAIALLTAVHAQDQCAALAADIPQCAIKCIGTAASGAGCKGPTDYTCQCKNVDKINAQAINCVLSGCGADEGIKAQSAAAAVCACVASSGSGGSEASAGAEAVASAGTETVASAGTETVASTSTEAATSEAQTTTEVSVPSSSSPPYPTTVSQIGDGQIQVGTATASSIVPSSTSVTPFEGAAARVGGSVIAVVAGFAVVVAVL